MNIGEKLTLLCRERGIKVKHFEQDCGFANGYVQNLRKQGSMPSYDRMVKICQYFNISEQDLFGEDDSIPQIKTDSVFQLSDEERRIIIAYRRLTTDQKDMVCAMLDVKRNIGVGQKSPPSKSTA